MTAAFANDWEEKVKEIFGTEWPKIVQNAEIYRQSGEVESPIKDAFDYLGVNHFYNLFDQYFGVIFPPELRQQPGAEKELKAAVLRWAKSIRNVRDPLSHPTEEDLSKWDALSSIDAAKRIVRIFAPSVATEIESIGEQLIGGKPSRDPLMDNLPPREMVAVQFIGRATELNRLRQWLKDEESHRWMLVGDGGKGKTAIAYEFAVGVKYLAPSPYQLVLWLSAKKRGYVGRLVVPIPSPDFSSLESLIDRILIEYGGREETNKPLRDKKKMALELLNDIPGLVVIDDLDSLVNEDPQATEFVTYHLPHTNSKVLITSRISFIGLEPTMTRVEGFDVTDGREFIKSRINILGLDPKGFTRQTIATILKVTDNSPLYIDDLLRLCAIGMPVPSATESWQREGGEAAREFAIRREFDMLSFDGKKILLACSLSPQPCSISELEAIVEVKGKQLESALIEVQRLFMIPGPRYIAGEPRFVMNTNTRALVLQVMSQTDLYRRLEAAANALWEQLAPSAERSFEVSTYLKYTSALVKLGRHQEAEELLLNEALTKYPNESDLLGQLGWVYMNWEPRRVTQAGEKFARASALKCKRWDVYWYWWKMECEEAEWAAAVKAAKAGLKRFPDDWKLKFAAGYAGTRLGRELQHGLFTQRARDELLSAKEHLEDALTLVPAGELSLEDRQLHSDLLRALVLNSEALRNVPKLGSYLGRWCNEHPDDRDTLTECARLSKKFPNLVKMFSKLREYLRPAEAE